MRASEKYMERVQAVAAQRLRLHGNEAYDSWTGACARRFRYDPHRDLPGNIASIAGYLQPDDTVIDVGGGAGRISLPLALRCRQVTTVDPSMGMQAEFLSCAEEAGIRNANYVLSDWLDAEPMTGDLVITANVTYFVADIVGFVKKMEASCRRRAIINVWSTPPPNQSAQIFKLVYGEILEEVPGHRHLLPVLWEMGILPDVLVQPEELPSPELPQTEEQAVEQALMGRWLGQGDGERARQVIENHFSQLFRPTDKGFQPLWPTPSKELLITWEQNNPE